MLTLPEVNIWAILVSAILSIAIGTLWYSPYVFGKIWMDASGITEPNMKDAQKAYIGAFINSLIMASVLAVFIRWIGAATLRDGACVGFLAWLGFVATTQFSGVLWDKKPLKLFLIHTGCMLLTLLVIGALLAWWR